MHCRYPDWISHDGTGGTRAQSFSGRVAVPVSLSGVPNPDSILMLVGGQSKECVGIRGHGEWVGGGRDGRDGGCVGMSVVLNIGVGGEMGDCFCWDGCRRNSGVTLRRQFGEVRKDEGGGGGTSGTWRGRRPQRPACPGRCSRTGATPHHSRVGGGGGNELESRDCIEGVGGRKYKCQEIQVWDPNQRERKIYRSPRYLHLFKLVEERTRRASQNISETQKRKVFKLSDFTYQHQPEASKQMSSSFMLQKN